MPTPAPALDRIRVDPPLRLARAMAQQEGHAEGSILRKVGWWLLIGLLGVALAVAVIAEGRRQRDPEQSWFWTPEWLAGELEADQDVAAGRGQVFESDDEFLAHLDEIPPTNN